MVDRVAYDEFGLFHENAEEFGLPYDGPPTVRHEPTSRSATGRRLSALVWGDGAARARAPPRRRAERAHVGHRGHGARPPARRDRPPRPRPLRRPGAGQPRRRGRNAARRRRGGPRAGARRRGRRRACRSAGSRRSRSPTQHPELVRRVVLVDVTPGVDGPEAAAIVAFVNGPESFADFDELLARTIEFNPTRSESSLRRGILHNALAARRRQLGVALPPLHRRRRAAATDGLGRAGDPHRGPVGRGRADHGAR